MLITLTAKGKKKPLVVGYPGLYDTGQTTQWPVVMSKEFFVSRGGKLNHLTPTPGVRIQGANGSPMGPLGEFLARISIPGLPNLPPGDMKVLILEDLQHDFMLGRKFLAQLVPKGESLGIRFSQGNKTECIFANSSISLWTLRERNEFAKCVNDAFPRLGKRRGVGRRGVGRGVGAVYSYSRQMKGKVQQLAPPVAAAGASSTTSTCPSTPGPSDVIIQEEPVYPPPFPRGAQTTGNKGDPKLIQARGVMHPKPRSHGS